MLSALLFPVAMLLSAVILTRLLVRMEDTRAKSYPSAHQAATEHGAGPTYHFPADIIGRHAA